MLAAFFGDTHGNINTMYSITSAWEKRTGLEIDLVVQVGDFGFWLSEDTVDKMTAKHAKVLTTRPFDPVVRLSKTILSLGALGGLGG